MPEGASAPVTRPENCVVGFGIPITVDAFRHLSGSTSEPRRRFVDKFDGLLGPYLSQVIAPCQRYASRFEKLGVRVVDDLTLAGYSALFRGGGVQAVILLSHFEDGEIELSDGFADAAAIVRATPDDFAGCLDLCACHPRKLVPELRQRRPRCDIRWIDAEATPAFWVLFFWQLFCLLRRKPAPYLDAQVELLLAAGLAVGKPAEERPS